MIPTRLHVKAFTINKLILQKEKYVNNSFTDNYIIGFFIKRRFEF